MLIYVDTPSGRTIGVSLRSSDTVAHLKVRIEDEEWIPRGTVIQVKLHSHGISLIDCNLQIDNVWHIATMNWRMDVHLNRMALEKGQRSASHDLITMRETKPTASMYNAQKRRCFGSGSKPVIPLVAWKPVFGMGDWLLLVRKPDNTQKN
jgi:hypothetical protein